jgi:hypothetical protein
LTVAGDIIDAGLSIEVFLQTICLVTGQELGKPDHHFAVGGKVFFQVAIIYSFVGASRDTVGQPSDTGHIGAEVALHNRSFLGRDLVLHVVVDEQGFRGNGGLPPVKEPPVVGTGRHAKSAADAALLVDEDYALRGYPGSADRANAYAGGILTLHARSGNKLSAAPGEVKLVHLYPLLRLRDEVTFYTGEGTLGRLVQTAATIAPLEVNNHSPASPAAVPLLILASYL